MKNFWTKLSIFWKLVIVVVFLVLIIFTWDKLTGGISSLKGWMNDKAYEERMEKDADYEKQIAEIKTKNIELDKKLIESEAKAGILEQNDKALTEQTKQELAKLDQALAAQDAEEARTAEPVDAYTRCIRTKQKMLDLKIASAQEINCENYKE